MEPRSANFQNVKRQPYHLNHVSQTYRPAFPEALNFPSPKNEQNKAKILRKNSVKHPPILLHNRTLAVIGVKATENSVFESVWRNCPPRTAFLENKTIIWKFQWSKNGENSKFTTTLSTFEVGFFGFLFVMKDQIWQIKVKRPHKLIYPDRIRIL